MKNSNRYQLILLRHQITVPGAPVAKDRLIDVEGTPHAGGIDVVFGDKIVTVPWSGIVSAIRATEGVR